jgi:hypothetical protein
MSLSSSLSGGSDFTRVILLLQAAAFSGELLYRLLQFRIVDLMSVPELLKLPDEKRAYPGVPAVVAAAQAGARVSGDQPSRAGRSYIFAPRGSSTMFDSDGRIRFST